MANVVCSVNRMEAGVHVVDGAGVKINRIIGTQRLSYIDPFVLLDEIRSRDPEDYIAGFPTHPHRGIETITYMKSGSFRHRDSRGGGGLLTGGCVQWMTAGRGILHSEMPEKSEGELWGFQLWLNLPAKDKMVEPRYQHLSPDDIPVVEKDGVEVVVVSGSYEGTHGPAKNWVEADYFDVKLPQGALFRFDIEAGRNSFCYVHTGEVLVCPGGSERKASAKELVELPGGTTVEIRGDGATSGFLFLSSKPNNEPIVRGGPFVMNSEEEIRRAWDDYSKGLIG